MVMLSLSLMVATASELAVTVLSALWGGLSPLTTYCCCCCSGEDVDEKSGDFHGEYCG